MCFSSFHFNGFVNIALAKPSHMAKPGMKVRGDQKLQGREPNTERPVCRPFMQLSCQSSQWKLETGQKGTFCKQNTVNLIICRFPICKFAYLLKFVCNNKINVGVLPQSFLRMLKAVTMLNCSTHMFPVLRANKMALCVSLHTANKCPLRRMLSATCFAFLCCLLVIALCKMVPMCSAEVLTGIPEHKEAVMCLKKIYYAWAMLGSSMSYRAVGHEFNVNESTLLN